MVSAWATKNRVVLGQVKVDEKSNEITAIPELLDLLQKSLRQIRIVGDEVRNWKEQQSD